MPDHNNFPVPNAVSAQSSIFDMELLCRSWTSSTKKLLDIVDRERVALVVFGHDGAQWKQLKKSPEYYD